MTRTLRRERIQKFEAILSCLGKLTQAEVEATAELLADAAASRTEVQQEEVIVSADRKVDAILDLDRQAKTAEDAGQAWRGREFLVGSEYCKYGDWWYKKTGLEMYGAKGKAKINAEWMKSFRVWAEYNVTIESLEKAYEAEKWRTISKTSQLTDTALAIQAAPPVVSNTNLIKSRNLND